MKSIFSFFLTAFLAIFLFNSANSQGVWDFGLQGGLNMSWISQPTIAGEELNGDFGSRLSWNAGFMAEYGFSRKSYLQMGLILDQRGFSYKEGDKTKGTDITVRAHYFELPFLYRWAFVATEKFDIYALMGPSFAFLTGGRIVGESYTNGVSGDVDTKVSDTYNSTAFGFKLGLGAEIPIAGNRGATFFDLRYNIGISDVISQGGYYENSDIDATPQVLSFVIGVKGYIE